MVSPNTCTHPLSDTQSILSHRNGETCANPQAPSPTSLSALLGLPLQPDHPPRHHGEGWELELPLCAAVKVSGGRAMPAISTCHSPQPGHRTQEQIPLSPPARPWAIFTSHCQGITKRRETLAPLRDWEVEIQTDRVGTRQGERFGKTEGAGERN